MKTHIPDTRPTKQRSEVRPKDQRCKGGSRRSLANTQGNVPSLPGFPCDLKGSALTVHKVWHYNSTGPQLWTMEAKSDGG